MKEINKMRLGVIRELKNVRKLIDSMERRVKNRKPEEIQRAYIFLVHLVREMNVGCLSPDSISTDVALAQELQDK